MLQQQMQRLRYFLANQPKDMHEVTECVNLALERATEISLEYIGREDRIPTQLKGELNMLKELTDEAFEAGENLLVLRRNANRCEDAIRAALDVAALGTDRITIH